MSYKNRRVILQNENNGFVVKIKPIKEIREGIKGSRILIKRMENGKEIGGNLFYGWMKSEQQASDLFENICQTLHKNKDNFSMKFWDFPYHPIHFLIKHRN